jgi:hypothetical protein
MALDCDGVRFLGCAKMCFCCFPCFFMECGCVLEN